MDSGYNVVHQLVNAADYGVPQQRHRVFIVGFRDDLDAEFRFPEPTHSKAALMHDQWITGEYWDRHKVPVDKRPEPASRSEMRKLDRQVKESDPAILLRPWRTVRDAFVGLPEPTLSDSRKFHNHRLWEGAKSYDGHTGSPLDLPSKALKAGDHGVPGGENMLRRVDGSVRYFTVREAARLQTFPDMYELHGVWSEAMRQLGNAVPVLLAQKVAGAVASHLEIAAVRANLSERSVTIAT